MKLDLEKKDGGLKIGNAVAETTALLGKLLLQYAMEYKSLWDPIIKCLYGKEWGG